MYEPHPTFRFPANDSVKIWRYMDFTKFVSLLETNSLYFARADQLGDPFECAIPAASRRKKAIDQYLFESKRKECFVNCWHVNESESAAMWRLYLKSDEGIAIRSTARKLADSFNGFADAVFIGEVRYIDYKKGKLPLSNSVLEGIVHKRVSFAHENELRAVIWHIEVIDDKVVAPDFLGINFPVELNDVIEEVYVAPTSPQWLLDLVRAVAKRYGLKASVRQSELSEPPMQ